MSEQANVEIVKQGYDAFGRGDVDGLLGLMADGVEWVTPGSSDLPTAGHRQGKDQVRQFFGLINELYDFQAFEPQHFIAQGDAVVVTGTDRLVVKATGSLMEEDWAHVFTLAGGKIVAFKEYLDTAALVADMHAAKARA